MVEQSEGGDFPPKKAQSETTAQQQQPADFPPKKLARQLDFTAGYTGGTSVAASSSSSCTATVVPATATATPTVAASGDYPHQSQPPQPFAMPSQPQLQQHVIRPGQPPKPQPQPPIQLMTIQPPLAPPAAHPPIRPMKPESPRPRPRSSTSEGKDGTPKKQKQCNCKHSKCLKLYCECFASGIYCKGCNCVNCYNNEENEAARREAVEITLDRNPLAFRPKIASSPHAPSREEVGEAVVIGKHNKGCHCKKSGCLKKYCECFQANILCSDLCKCMDCKNFEGSEERQALFHGDHANNIAYIQQAANAAITGAIGSSGFGSPPVSKKRKAQELFFGSVKDPLNRLGQFQQANHIKTSVPASSVSTIPGARLSNPTGMGASKFTYRSLLADMIGPQDLKELCSVMVLYSAEAAKMLADERSASGRPSEETRESTEDHLHDQKDGNVTEKASLDGCLNGSQSEKITPEESASDGADVSKGRPMSPGTLALMCDEQDTLFTAATSPTGGAGQGSVSSQLPPGEGAMEAFAEQERIVLTKFRDCLKKLITLGEIKERKCSSFARSESSSQRDLMSNGNAGVRIDALNQLQQASSNGISRSISPPPPPPRRTSSSTAGTASSDSVPSSSSVENGNVKPITEKAL